MKKISVTIDVKKIDKSKLVPRKYTDKTGTEIEELNYTFDIVELNEPKDITEGDTWILKKTHFAVEGQSKEERLEKKPSVFIGEGKQFIKKDEPLVDPVTGAEIDIPF